MPHTCTLGYARRSESDDSDFVAFDSASERLGDRATYRALPRRFDGFVPDNLPDNA